MFIDIRDNPAVAHAAVYLDGVLLPWCVWADSEAGDVGCAEYVEPGSRNLKRDEHHQIQYFRKTGKVEIYISDTATPGAAARLAEMGLQRRPEALEEPVLTTPDG